MPRELLAKRLERIDRERASGDAHAIAPFDGLSKAVDQTLVDVVVKNRRVHGFVPFFFFTASPCFLRPAGNTARPSARRRGARRCAEDCIRKPGGGTGPFSRMRTPLPTSTGGTAPRGVPLRTTLPALAPPPLGRRNDRYETYDFCGLQARSPIPHPRSRVDRGLQDPRIAFPLECAPGA